MIRELARVAKKRGDKYLYTASEVARVIPTTRKTLRRYDLLVERVVDDLKSMRRMCRFSMARDQTPQLSQLRCAGSHRLTLGPAYDLSYERMSCATFPGYAFSANGWVSCARRETIHPENPKYRDRFLAKCSGESRFFRLLRLRHIHDSLCRCLGVGKPLHPFS